MIQIDKKLIQELFDKAVVSERKRMNYDLRTSKDDGGQRMLNALLPGTRVAIHRHPHSNENVLLLCGKLVEVLYKASPCYDKLSTGETSPKGEGELIEIERIPIDPSVGNFGCVVPANTWHTVEVLEPSVIYEAKDGRYGDDGSENWIDPLSSPLKGEENTHGSVTTPSNCIGDLKQQITYLIGMERQSGSMDNCTPLYISRMLNVPLEEVEKAMKEMGM